MMNRIFRLSALALLTLVAACNGVAQTDGGPVASTAPGENGASSGAEIAALPPPRTGPLTPETLKGLTAAQLKAELGAPDFRRRDPPAEIWQYRVRACTLDLFLYDEGGSRVTTHFAVRGPTGAGIDERACLTEILARRTETPGS
ncbi:MAG: hypothetical protein Q7R40_04995 [Phaeospirillum sp.]|nr:hypothetical protein [Phaeospirillum sp.]